MTFEEFNEAVMAARELVPEKFKKLLRKEGIEIIPREQVPAEIKRRYPRSVVYGVFVGLSRKEQSAFSYQTEPVRIEIYQESFETSFGRVLTGEMKTQIARTVVHEIAHYFGFEEKEIRARGF